MTALSRVPARHERLASNAAAFLRDLFAAAWKNGGPVTGFEDGSMLVGEGPDLARAEWTWTDKRGRRFRITAEQIETED